MTATHPKVQEAANACSRLAKMIANNDTLLPLVVLHGPPGCGKTHLAKAMVRWATLNSHSIRDRPLSISSVSWPTITDGFKEGMYGVVDDLMKDDFVVIDDIGAEHDPSRNATDKLCQILSRRETKWTLITTNLAPTEWGERWDVRVADRMLRRSTVVDMAGVPSFSTL